MKSSLISALLISCSLTLLSPGVSFAAPAIEISKNPQINVFELISRMGRWDEADVADFAKAD